MKKKKIKEGTQNWRVADMLRNRRMVSGAEFAHAGILRYGGYIDVLRKEYGFEIGTIRPEDGPTPHHPNTWWYELLHDPDGPIIDHDETQPSFGFVRG